MSIVRTTEIIVPGSLQSAFEYVADLTKHPEWNAGLHIEPREPGPVAVGKTYASRGAVATQKDRPNTVEVTEYAPPRIFSFISHDPGFGKVFHAFELNPAPGGVQIKRTLTLSLGFVQGLLFRTVIYPLIGRPAMSRSMAALQRRLEQRASQSADTVPLPAQPPEHADRS